MTSRVFFILTRKRLNPSLVSPRVLIKTTLPPRQTRATVALYSSPGARARVWLLPQRWVSAFRAPARRPPLSPPHGWDETAPCLSCPSASGHLSRFRGSARRSTRVLPRPAV